MMWRIHEIPLRIEPNQLLDGRIDVARIFIHGQDEKITGRKRYGFTSFHK